MTRRVWACAALLLSACGSTGPGEPPRAPVPEGVTLVPMPPEMLAKCLRYEQLRPACPAEVPAVDESRLERARASRRERGLRTFFAEWNAPYPGITKKNAPPRFAHVNVLAGDLEVMAGLDVTGELRGPPPKRRTGALSLGARTWNGRSGRLLLAPSYPHGGIEGDHLVFRWEQGDVRYSISVHAWRPLARAEATLRAMVGSLP